MPRTWMALPYRDAAFGRALAARFGVSQLPAVVVLAPSGAVLVPDAVREIQDLGPSCFQGWRQAAELLDRNFQEPQEQEQSGRCPGTASPSPCGAESTGSARRTRRRRRRKRERKGRGTAEGGVVTAMAGRASPHERGVAKRKGGKGVPS
ncbi:nucleoredoxin-like protein 1 [Agelaius phoeniceus]|uniref:nucleoredoxin-like protein 1 n=1 Tax=Agelaius phoeniceus TaxID=39638 RepID=UPI004055319D